MPVDTQKSQLDSLAACHMACFPQSLSTKLGAAYVRKTLEWFLVSPNRFLFHVDVQGKIAGYCGGFVPQKTGDGSSSGMLQYAYNEAVKGLMKKPWLLLHKEVRPQYRFLWLNIKRKFTGKVIPIGNPGNNPTPPAHVGLVVIGVHPAFRGSGIAQQLVDEFERKAKAYKRNELVLSVKVNNKRAIGAYKKFGWSIQKTQQRTYVMNKFI
jgi:ribosomal protein S18 acetylase RimI-like enzyme